MPATYKLHKPVLPDNKRDDLRGEIFPKGRTSLPVQEFLSGDRANSIVIKKLSTYEKDYKGLGECYRGYLQESVDPKSKNDIVNKLQNLHIRKMTSVLTKIRTTDALGGNPSINPLVEANKEVDISQEILTELEPFLLATMNKKEMTFVVSDDLSYPGSVQSRSKSIHSLKQRFIDVFGPKGSTPLIAAHLFVIQLQKAQERIHKNHPVNGFIGTILYEITRNPLYFEQPSPWFGFGADIDASFLSKMPTENRENRFWFSRVTAPNVYEHTNFRDNTLFFSTVKNALHAIDGVDYFSENVRKGVTLSDNAGSFSYYENSLSHAEIVQSSPKSSDTIKELQDEYYGPAAYSQGIDSFPKAKITGGFRFGEFTGCFWMSHWNTLNEYTRYQEYTLHGSKCSGSGKQSFVLPGAHISPRLLTGGSFDYATLMSGFYGTTVQDSLRNTIIISTKSTDPICKAIIVPPDSTKDKKIEPGQEKEKEKNSAFAHALIIGENCLSQFQSKNGFEKAIFLFSGNDGYLLGDSGEHSVWFNAGLNTRVGGTAGQGGVIGGISFCGEKVEFTGNVFYAAQIGGVLGAQASFSGYPFGACVRVENNKIVLHVLEVLKKKMRSFVKSIGADTVAQNDTMENAILEIPFVSEGNVIITDLERRLIRNRLKTLLSSSFGESEKQRLIRESIEWEIDTGVAKRVLNANEIRENMQWDETFRDLLSKKDEAIDNLYRFRAAKNLMSIENWTGSILGDGDLSIPNRLAPFVIRKIQAKMIEVSKNSPEISKTRVLSELIQTYLRVDSSIVNEGSWPRLKADQLLGVSAGFIEDELPKFIGEQAATEIHDALFPKKTNFSDFIGL